VSSLLTSAALSVAATVFDSLWEGALITGAVWLALRCLPQLGAATRYAIWLCALLAMFVIPALTVALSQQTSEPSIAATAAGADTSASIGKPVARTRTDTTRLSTAPKTAAGEPAPAVQRAAPAWRTAALQDAPAVQDAPVLQAAAATPALAAAERKSRITIPQSFAFGAALIWLLLACSKGARLLINVRQLAVLRRDARLWSAAHDYPVYLSDDVRVPVAVGFVRPAIILPASLVQQLRTDAVETIVVHEVAHLRRYDVWTNALARVTEALLALNPAAWFVMRRLSMEREIACDDWVVARTGAGDAFAHTLFELANRVCARAPLAAPSALGSRHSVVVRIERLLDSRPRRLRLSPSALGGTLMLLAMIAFIVQSISPVLAYAAEPNAPAPVNAAARVAANCAVPNRGIRLASFFGMKSHPRAMQLRSRKHSLQGPELPAATTVVAQYGAANVATFDLTVDATGRVRKVAVISTPPYPGMVEHVTRLMTTTAFEPSLQNCVPVAATVRTALRFPKPVEGTYSIVTPAYPKGWSSRHPAACKVPTVQHTGVPAFPDSMKNMPVDATYSASVKVHVGAAGTVTNATVVSPSGRQVFDDALIAAARRATYPLTEHDGFKQARPPGTALAWNAAHGSDTYLNCKPLPGDYVWNTTFARIVPIGLPGTGVVVLSH
jgi:TonB family protein